MAIVKKDDEKIKKGLVEVDVDKTIKVEEIRRHIGLIGGYGTIPIPEFTFDELRIDCLLLDTRKRWARGFEIKTSRKDFLQDDKWWQYSRFCSALSVACPSGLIHPDEIGKPFGLIWFDRDKNYPQNLNHIWKKKPHRFQRRNQLSWLWAYTRILELEMPRLNWKINNLEWQLAELNKRYKNRGLEK